MSKPLCIGHIVSGLSFLGGNGSQATCDRCGWTQHCQDDESGAVAWKTLRDHDAAAHAKPGQESGPK